MAHLVLLVSAPGCMLAFWWQLHRALAGNELSWAYTFEWPFFAVFAVVAWWQLLHDDPDTVGKRGLGTTPPGDPIRRELRWDLGLEDPELSSYNRYLARLASSGRRKTWRRTS